MRQSCTTQSLGNWTLERETFMSGHWFVEPTQIFRSYWYKWDIEFDPVQPGSEELYRIEIAKDSSCPLDIRAGFEYQGRETVLQDRQYLQTENSWKILAFIFQVFGNRDYIGPTFSQGSSTCKVTISLSKTILKFQPLLPPGSYRTTASKRPNLEV